jgi:hypothetical protein
VLKKLERFSPLDYHKLLEQWSQKSYIQPGEVLISELHLAPDKHASFPVDNVYTLVFTAGQPIDPAELAKGLAAVLKVGVDKRMQNLVLPCLGRTWQHSKDSYATSYEDFFPAFFASVPSDMQSPTIYLSLYRQWPSFELEEAVGSVNSAWASALAPKASVPANHLYREKYRTTMLFWFLCLFVCSFFTFPGLKNFLILSAAFLSMALGSDALVAFLTQGRPSLESTLHYAVLVVLAIGFPAIVRWDPKEIFKSNTPPQKAP